MSTFFNLNEVARHLQLKGIDARVGCAGGNIYCVFVGEVGDDNGDDRFHVAVGPGWLDRRDGKAYGTPGELSIEQDTAADHPVYVVRWYETPERIADRAATLYRAVDARRKLRAEPGVELGEYPMVIPPIPGEDMGGEEATTVEVRPLAEALQATASKINLVCTQQNTIFAQTVTAALTRIVAEDGPVGAVVYATSGNDVVRRYTGTITGVDDEAGVQFEDGVVAPLDYVIAVTV